MRTVETPKMAVYNPHYLSHKLCRVFDAGYSNVDTFAQQCEMEPKLIEQLAKSEHHLDPSTKHRIGRVLSQYYRDHPDLYDDASPASKRGVEEVVLRAKDWRGFEVTASTGKCIMYVEWPRKEVTQTRIDALWRWLDKEDPQPQLQAI
jgi:hypothetical protein